VEGRKVAAEVGEFVERDVLGDAVDSKDGNGVELGDSVEGRKV
jgi:hypothetical protein